MNAGANGKEIKQILKQVHSIDFQGNEKTRTSEEIDFAYRYSNFMKNKEIITEVFFNFNLVVASRLKNYSPKFSKKEKPVNLFINLLGVLFSKIQKEPTRLS